MNIETLAMKKNRKQTKENAQHTNSNKGSSARKRAKTHVRRQSTDNRPSLKATGAQEKGSSVQPLKPVSIDREVAREIQKSKNIGVLLRQRGKAIKRLGTDYREALRREAAKLYAAAQLAACNKDLWRSLCEDRVWAKYGLRPTVADQYNALWFVMLHAFGPTRAGRQKASKFHCALKLFFAEGVPADDLPSKIKDAKGIEALARANAKRDENTPPTQEKAGGGETPPAQPAASQPSSSGKTKSEPKNTVILHGTLVENGSQLLQLKPPCRAELIVEIKGKSGNKFEVVIADANGLSEESPIFQPGTPLH